MISEADIFGQLQNVILFVCETHEHSVLKVSQENYTKITRKKITRKLLKLIEGVKGCKATLVISHCLTMLCSLSRTAVAST